jgi:lipoprotein-anchoring transpeptidase ErfK/SrfK
VHFAVGSRIEIDLERWIMAGCVYEGKQYSTCSITVVLDQTWRGVLTVSGQNKGDTGPTTLLKTDVVGGPNTPIGTFHASYWEKDHVSTKYGSLADTPYSKTLLGGNAFGPYQLHMSELERRGIYIHGTMGPRWNPSTTLNALVSPTSHGCIRMANTANVTLRDMLPKPSQIPVVIKRK